MPVAGISSEKVACPLFPRGVLLASQGTPVLEIDYV